MAFFKRRVIQLWLIFIWFQSFSGVLCFSELSFISEPSHVTVLPNDNVLLDCLAQGEPPISISWLRNGAKLSENEHIQFLSNGSLYISNVWSVSEAQSDDGFYQCLVKNKYGAILSQRSRLTISSISSFVTQPSPVVVSEGSVARFSCSVTAVPAAIITWELNQSALPLETERITVLPNGVLQIREVKPEDAGNYRCVATNIANRLKSKEAMLSVMPALAPRPLQRPQIVAGPQNITASLHQSVVLECIATGNPRPLVSWSRADSKPIDVFNARVLGSGNLVISDVKPEHSGVYLCRATTPRTRNFTIAAANLTVLVPPSIVEKPESQTRPRAGTARFSCQAEGLPTPRITWLKNGEEMCSNGRIKMYNSKLVITQIMPEDDAMYQCQAENSQGSVLSLARLIVVMSEDRPSAPRNVHAETISSSAILLAWERPQYNADKVIAYSIHYMKAEGLNNEEYQAVIGNDTTSHIVDDLEPARNYTFYIVAYMPMGASRMSEQVSQSTLEDVPLRTPELSLISRSPTDILVSWQPLPSKLSRGRVSAYRLSYRTASNEHVTSVELPGMNTTSHLLQDLQPDTIYLMRLAASTRVGWSQPSAWSSHRTPKTSSAIVPPAPALQLEPLNCTSVTVRWHPSPSDAVIQGYHLSYYEDDHPEGSPIQISGQDHQYSITGLGPRKKYHMKLWAVSSHGDGYQAHQTVITPACPSTQNRRLATLPSPDHVHAQTNSSSVIRLTWGRPAFVSGKPVNYTIRYSPAQLFNASAVRFLHTTNQKVMVQGLRSNTRYEFAVRLHMDQMSSPWSAPVYQRTLLEAPSTPPLAVRVTLIEDDTALVSWRQPELPDGTVTVTHYTILYASQRAWLVGEWQVLQREGGNTMALLERLVPGNTYLVKISASNQAGDGPFSSIVELPVQRSRTHQGKNPRHTDGLSETTVFSDGLYNIDEKSMTGIIVGVCIALACICICVFILINKTRGSRTSSSSKMIGQNAADVTRTAPSLPNGHQAERAEVLVPMMEPQFIDTKGGTELMINTAGPIIGCGKNKKRKWQFFGSVEKHTSKKGLGRASFYKTGRTELRYEDERGVAAAAVASKPILCGPLCVSETSNSSEVSRETSDSGNYSQDEMSDPNSHPQPPLSSGKKCSKDFPVPTSHDIHLHVKATCSQEQPSTALSLSM